MLMPLPINRFQRGARAVALGMCSLAAGIAGSAQAQQCINRNASLAVE